MSIPRRPDPALLIISVLASKWKNFDPQLLNALQTDFGPLIYQSELIVFDQTDYYNQELGTPIFRRILGFKELVSQDRLVDIKLRTNEMEKEFSLADGRRVFNLDPGILNQERLVLATGKNFSHRIYLGKGIWADLTLIFQKKKWQCLAWTFPDYATQEIQEELLRLRHEYKKLLNK